VKNGGKASATSGVWFAYTSIAVYDAVNTITGKYRPFYYRSRDTGSVALLGATGEQEDLTSVIRDYR
jgi:hypothetical protein